MEQKFSKRKQLGTFSKDNKKSIKITTADKWYSLYIRIRDIKIIRSPEEAYCYCVTCGKIIHWKKRSDDDKTSAECGHFISRRHPTTRFHEKNCHAQCKECNHWKNGEQVKYGFKVDELYGPGTAKYLLDLSGLRGQKVLSKLALKDIAKEYRLKVKELAKQKNIKI